jgi:sarcosine oxidase subunit alpha
MNSSDAGVNRISGKGRLARSKTVRFSFDGKTYTGLEGDTLASALIANNVHLVGRSFKYHRPRGFLSAGPEEPNALVGIRRDDSRQQPNVRATVQEVYDGLQAKSQNSWPGLTFDVGAVNDGMSRFFPAGFYYKTFMWPKPAWEKLYEPIIRSAAGLGEAPTEADPDSYANQYAHVDVLVVGAGLAGLAAALAAAKTGATVIVADEHAVMGGRLLSETSVEVDGHAGKDWAAQILDQLADMDNVTLLSRTTAWGYYHNNMVTLLERVTEHQAAPAQGQPRERLWQVRTGRTIIATGAIERHMIFPDNDRPGIMLSSAGQRFLNEYGVTVGQNVTIYTAHDSAYGTAKDLADSGVNIVAIVDTRAKKSAAAEEAAGNGLRVITNAAITDTKGRLRIRAATVRNQSTGKDEILETDALLMSSGWTPSVHLYSQSRGKVIWQAEHQRFVPGDNVQDCVSVGACKGTDDIGDMLSEALEAGHAAGSGTGDKPDIHITAKPHWSGGMIGAGEGAQAGHTSKAFVDFQNDVTAKDIRLAVKEGFHSIEHVKRYTTNGMATDQGKTSNMHGLAIAAETLGKPIPQVGLTTFRAPYTPLTFGAIVNHSRNELFDPARKTPMHDVAVKHGAVFEDVGQWKRAWYFPKGDETMAEAVNRECKTVRTSVGLFDATTLGKIEIKGPDATRFMNLMYSNAWDKLGVGRTRYGIMLREDGYIYDDGVVGRMAEDHFHVTTTTGGAASVMQHMEDYLQTEFPQWDVWATSISEQWAVLAVAGPKAREIIEDLVEGIDLSNEAFPHMSVREGKIAGLPTRLFRVSFSGELGFEINVPADYGSALMELLADRVLEAGGCLYGTETMHVLRAEKGFIIVGQDTDGTLTPNDAGVGWAVSKKKEDFVGKRGLQRPDLLEQDRKMLVGLLTSDPDEVLEEGAQLVFDTEQETPMKMVGHVTSSYWSENLGRSIAMATLTGGMSHENETVFVSKIEGEDLSFVEATVSSPIFYDSKNERTNG